jgi:hypothetical protein
MSPQLRFLQAKIRLNYKKKQRKINSMSDNNFIDLHMQERDLHLSYPHLAICVINDTSGFAAMNVSTVAMLGAFKRQYIMCLVHNKNIVQIKSI